MSMGTHDMSRSPNRLFLRLSTLTNSMPSLWRRCTNFFARNIYWSGDYLTENLHLMKMALARWHLPTERLLFKASTPQCHNMITAHVITDHSIFVHSDQNIRTRQGTTRELLQAHGSAKGKILNALDFPAPYDPNPPSSIASSYVAWKRTHGLPGCFQEFPASSSKWGLAATTGAYHGFHIDCDGFATYIDCVAGSKWWVIASPKQLHYTSTFACIDDLFDYISREGDGGVDYVLEAILLRPGTRL
jgi:hypothetical protein